MLDDRFCWACAWNPNPNCECRGPDPAPEEGARCCECRGSGEYVGFRVVEVCRECDGTGRV